MAQRITRAKQKIAAAKVPYRLPEAVDLTERLGSVLTVLFLVFNEGNLATGEGDPVRTELTNEAIRLTRILRQLLPAESEVAGLLGLLVLPEARVRNRQRLPVVCTPIPRPLTWIAEAHAGLRYGIDWERIDHLGARWLRVSTLLFHGTADDTVPIATSDGLARAHPDLVREVSLGGATHVGA